MNQEILLDTGGTLYYDVPGGRPSAATATIYNPDGTSITSPTVTNDPTNTTLHNAASAGHTSIHVTSATGIEIRRRYLLTNPSGQSEWVRAKAISGTTITLFDALAYAHTSDSTLVGTRLTAPVTSGNAATLAEGYEIRWSVTVDSESHVYVDQWDVVRQIWPDPLLAQWEFRRQMGDLALDLSESIADRGEDFRDSVEEAVTGVKTDILVRGLHHNRFRSHSEFKRPVAWRVVLDWAARGENVPNIWQAEGAQAWIDHVEKQYHECLTTALNTARSYDEDESGVVNEHEREKAWGFARLRR